MPGLSDFSVLIKSFTEVTPPTFVVVVVVVVVFYSAFVSVALQATRKIAYLQTNTAKERKIL